MSTKEDIVRRICTLDLAVARLSTQITLLSDEFTRLRNTKDDVALAANALKNAALEQEEQ